MSTINGMTDKKINGDLQLVFNRDFSLLSVLLFLLILISFDGYCEHELDFRASLIGGAASPQENTLTYWDKGLNIYYLGNMPLNEKLAILTNTHFDNYTPAVSVNSPHPQINHRQNEILYLGIDYTDNVKVQYRNFFHLLGDSRSIGFPVEYRAVNKDESPSIYREGDLQQHYKAGADLLVSIPIGRFTINADILYQTLNYDYTDYVMSLTNQFDADLWINSSLQFKLPGDKVKLVLKGEQKHDLNVYDGYNLTKLYAGVSTFLPLMKRKLLLSGDIFGRHNASRVMKLKGYIGKDNGLGVESHFRGIWQVAKLTYLKGDAVFDISAIVTKTRYELSLRKVLRNNTSFEGGYWMSQGSLFPRMCGYFQSDVVIIPQLNVLPTVKYYWLCIDESVNSYSYYRTDLELALEYLLKSSKKSFMRNMAVQCGGQYRFFDKEYDIYVPTLQIFLGMKMHI